MGSFGWNLPLEFGGAPSADEKIYRSLRAMLGTGGVAVTETGIDGLELLCEAQALAAISAFDERAALQSYPNFLIDNLSAFEDILGIIPGASDSEEARREVIASEWVARRSSEIPTLQQTLLQIDSRLLVLDDSWANSKVTIFGLPFYPYVETAWMTGPKFTAFPSYSSRSEFFVLLNLGMAGAVPGKAELAIIDRVRRLLKLVLPAGDVPYIITENTGLIAGVSPVGYAGVQGS